MVYLGTIDRGGNLFLTLFEMSWKVKFVPTNYLAANNFKSFVLLRVIDMSCKCCSFVWNNIIRKNIQFLNHFGDLRDEQILSLKGKFTVHIQVLSLLTLIWGGPPLCPGVGLPCWSAVWIQVLPARCLRNCYRQLLPASTQL